jgi:hypothetical protein
LVIGVGHYLAIGHTLADAASSLDLGSEQKGGSIMSIHRRVAAATAVLALAGGAAVPPASADPEPTLGQAWTPNQDGYGMVRPAKVFNGGDPTGMIWDISWSSWGGERAEGTGTSYWEAPGAAVAESVSRPATIVAYNLGTCDGQLMYQAAKWYFPGEGESFDPRGHYNICTGDYVDAD